MTQNLFPSTGNATISGMSYLSTGNRVYMQYPAALANNWSRGFFSQGIYWDNNLSLWQVKGSTTSSDFSLLRYENSGHIGFFNGSSTGSSYTLDNAALENYRHMTILTNGNVGIGIKTPVDKLAVNGNIRAKEVKVETANWPDYVFEDGYRLPDLKEVANYIKINKHLPGVPSAEEVSNEGINLGEMNRKLLENAEEVMLYLIRLNTKIDELVENNKRLEDELNQLKTK